MPSFLNNVHVISVWIWTVESGEIKIKWEIWERDQGTTLGDFVYDILGKIFKRIGSLLVLTSPGSTDSSLFIVACRCRMGPQFTGDSR
jgi:hypothetical protein